MEDTKENFIRKAREIYGWKYDYSKVEYKDSQTKVCIICPVHGEIWETPEYHISKRGCLKCYTTKKSTTKEFVFRAKQIHGNKYDYSKTEYVNLRTKVCIICQEKDEYGKEHGEFWITPRDHIHSRSGCKKCAGVERMTNETFILKSIKKYGDKYDYSKVDYKNNKTKVCIICHEKDEFGEEHGEFWQRPNDHLTGYECPKCKKAYKPTTEEWIKRARSIHGNEYDYSKAEYKTAFTKVCIICPKHGEFWQRPANHIYHKAKCPSCNSDNKSKMEENIHLLLDKQNITHERQKTFPWLKNKRSLFLDFYIPYKKIGIEVQGDQHFTAVKRFGGQKFLELQQERDKVKKQLCEEHGIKMFYITKKNYNIDEIIDYLNQK